ncbi:phytosulfokines 4 [Phragmites australis]|uniref:phytosulfokines 4 n=1 Tax=Phragmites australis TaxID=29695 RepID=UPI002D786439|nr:phytosulfokines 4 [Phragmites australis]
MASTSRQLQVTLFLVAALLFLVCTRSQAARPEPGSSDHMPQRAVSTSLHEKIGSGLGVKMDQQEEPQAMTECEGGEDVGECLMRRTLVAHTDYIYTQGKHN